MNRPHKNEHKTSIKISWCFSDTLTTLLSTCGHKSSNDSMLMNWKRCGEPRPWNIGRTIPDLFDGLRKKLRKLQAG